MKNHKKDMYLCVRVKLLYEQSHTWRLRRLTSRIFGPETPPNA